MQSDGSNKPFGGVEEQILDLWPEHLGKPRLVQVLSGFISEAVVAVEANCGENDEPRKLVAKLSRQADQFAAATETRLLRTWSSKGLAPAVVASNGRLTVIEFVDGVALLPSDLGRAAATLHQCHHTESPGLPPLRRLLVQRFGDLATTGAGSGADNEVMGAAEQLLESIGDVPPRPLHGDCHPRNLLSRPSGVMVIDPLGASGDPSFDLATLAVTSQHHPFAALATLRGAYPGSTETLGAWFAWLAAFRWRVERNNRPGVADDLWCILETLANDPRWWRTEFAQP